jgi:hypothetical protein
VVGGVVYAFLALVEIRFSPQLHNWIYGYHQMDFSMAMRFGGYRPMIFMQTGLAVGMFMLAATIAAIVLHRTGRVKRAHGVLPRRGAGALQEHGRHHLCAGGAAGGGAGEAAARAAPGVPRAAHAALPRAAHHGHVPHRRARGAGREDQRGARAVPLVPLRPGVPAACSGPSSSRYFGWGGYNRNRHFDPVTGEDLSVTDGDWAIQIGSRGLVGFVAVYGLLTVPVVLTWRRIKRVKKRQDRQRLAALALITSLLVVDLLPNGLFHCLPFFLSGALFGLLQGLSDTRQGSPQAPRRRRRGGRERALDEVDELDDRDDHEEREDERHRPAHGARGIGLLEGAT